MNSLLCVGLPYMIDGVNRVLIPTYYVKKIIPYLQKKNPHF